MAAHDRLRRVWNGSIDRNPAAITRPETADEIKQVIDVANDLGVALAVRGGGHSIPGFSTCDGGIVLELGAFASVDVDPSERRATVGGGALRP